MTKITKATDWTGKKKITDYLSDYSVYPKLTAKLDAHAWSFDDAIVDEIVLWKLARYVEIPDSLKSRMDALKLLKPGNHRDGADVLKELLALKGMRLPMASTFLRFANPAVFQIFDRHICRALTGTFQKISPKKSEKATEVYWNFLDELIKTCLTLKISFKDADRILFEFDKQVNPPLSGKSD